MEGGHCENFLFVPLLFIMHVFCGVTYKLFRSSFFVGDYKLRFKQPGYTKDDTLHN